MSLPTRSWAHCVLSTHHEYDYVHDYTLVFMHPFCNFVQRLSHSAGKETTKRDNRLLLNTFILRLRIIHCLCESANKRNYKMYSRKQRLPLLFGFLTFAQRQWDKWKHINCSDLISQFDDIQLFSLVFRT